MMKRWVVRFYTADDEVWLEYKPPSPFYTFATVGLVPIDPPPYHAQACVQTRSIAPRAPSFSRSSYARDTSKIICTFARRRFGSLATIPQGDYWHWPWGKEGPFFCIGFMVQKESMLIIKMFDFQTCFWHKQLDFCTNPTHIMDPYEKRITVECWKFNLPSVYYSVISDFTEGKNWSYMLDSKF